MNIKHIYRLSTLAALVLTACTSENSLPSAIQSESVQAYVADNYPDVVVDNIAMSGSTVTATLSSGEELCFTEDVSLLTYSNKSMYGLPTDSLEVCSDSTNEVFDNSMGHHGKGHHGKGRHDNGMMGNGGKMGKGHYGNPGLKHRSNALCLDSLPSAVNTYISAHYAGYTVIHANSDTLCSGAVLQVMVCDSLSEPIMLVFDQVGSYLMKGIRMHYTDVPSEVSSAISTAYPSYTVSNRCSKYVLADGTIDYRVYLKLERERLRITLKADGSIVCQR